MFKFHIKNLPISLLLLFTTLLYFQIFYEFISNNSPELAQTDFVPYLTGAVILQQNSIHSLYQPTVFKSFQEHLVSPLLAPSLVYRALPFVTLLYYPFTFFDFKTSYYLFSTLSLCSLILINIFVSKIFPKIQTLPLWPLILFVIYPTFNTLVYGQTSLLTTLFLIICYLLLLRRQYFSAGLCLAFLLIKPHLYFIYAIFLVTIYPKLSLLKGMFVGIFFSLILCVLISGPYPILSYPSYILDTETQMFGSHPNDYQNLSSFLPPYLTFVILIVVLLVIKKQQSRLPILQQLSAITLLSPLFAFHTPSYELVTYVFPLAFLLQRQAIVPLAILFSTLLIPRMLNNISISIPIFSLLGLYLIYQPILPIPTPIFLRTPPFSKS